METVLTDTILRNPYIPHRPWPKQALFLTAYANEALYGGAAGGGKSDALLMAGLQYVYDGAYSGLLLRRTYADLSLPEALMDRAHDWLRGKDCQWHAAEKTWRFPSGASLTFGYMDTEQDRFRYQSAAFQFVGFDELTQFSERMYTFMLSRLRRLEGSKIPLRLMAATNPGGVGHEWVKLRFDPSHREHLVYKEVPVEVDSTVHMTTRLFIPAKLDDNPALDRVTYLQRLAGLDPITRSRYLAGDWDITEAGGMFRRQWFGIVEQVPADCRWCCFWDLAATEQKRGSDPDWTAGALVGLHSGQYFITDMRRVRATPHDVERLVAQCAGIDPPGAAIRMEQEPGSSGLNSIDQYARRVLVGYDFAGVKSTGSKTERARPLSAAAEAGNVKLVNGPWVPAFLEEADAFPTGAHDDQVDAVSGALLCLSGITGSWSDVHLAGRTLDTVDVFGDARAPGLVSSRLELEKF